MDFDLCLKLLDAEQIRQADQFTIKNESISSLDLMERASEEFARWFLKLFANNYPVSIFCGAGNNGGDGLVIARLLKEHKFEVEVYCIGDSCHGSHDFKINYDYIQNYLTPIQISTNEQFPRLKKEIIVIDAIFGSGLSRPVTGVYADLISHINDANCEVKIAVDIASGLGCSHRFEEGAIFNVSHTFSFQVPKLSMLLPDNEPFVGKCIVESIGLDEDCIHSLNSNYYYSTREFVQSILRERKIFAHKGVMGKNLLVVGSYGKMGAAVLAARACMRSGAGLLTSHVPSYGVDIMQSSIPESMVSPDSQDLYVSLIPGVNAYDAIGIGPGIGTDDSTQSLLKILLDKYDKPLVVDADALNILALNKEWLKLLPAHSILTPHPGEFRRLVGNYKDDYERLTMQINFCKEFDVVVLLKGANTSVCNPQGEVVFNSTGNPGMATGGSGDVLTGIITSLLGQGYDSFESAILGVYLHGLSGDLYVSENGQESLIASDLIDSLSEAYRNLRS